MERNGGVAFGHSKAGLDGSGAGGVSAPTAISSNLSRSMVMTATLFERLGGEAGITRLVTDIVDNHYRNPLIRTRFEQIKDRAAVERHSVEFLCAGSGGPQAYTGRDLPSVHRGMNISEQELIAAIDDIVAAMTKNKLEQSVQNEVVAILYSLKGEVLRL
jgi:hemoglobin